MDREHQPKGCVSSDFQAAWLPIPKSNCWNRLLKGSFKEHGFAFKKVPFNPPSPLGDSLSLPKRAPAPLIPPPPKACKGAIHLDNSMFFKWLRCAERATLDCAKQRHVRYCSSLSAQPHRPYRGGGVVFSCLTWPR